MQQYRYRYVCPHIQKHQTYQPMSLAAAYPHILNDHYRKPLQVCMSTCAKGAWILNSPHMISDGEFRTLKGFKMSFCLSLYIYISTLRFLRTYMSMCIYIYMYIYIYIYIYIHMYEHISTWVWVYAFMYMSQLMCMSLGCVCVCVCQGKFIKAPLAPGFRQYASVHACKYVFVSICHGVFACAVAPWQ